MSDVICEGDNSPGTSEIGETKMTKPPDKRKHDTVIAELMQKIEALQHEMRTLAPKPDDKVTEQLRSLRAEKESTIGRRKKIDTDLTALHQDIRKKNNELTKVQSNLQGYRNESRIDEAIQRLEYQLKMNNFKLSEEKKVVSEIDSLKRSKKVLCVVNGLKKELASMKENQRLMRVDRDFLFKKVTEIKQQEDGIKRKGQSDKTRQEELKKEIDVLYEQKRAEISQFKAQEKEFYKFRDSVRLKQRQEQQQKKVEERLAFEQDLAEYEASLEPYEKQKQQCRTLITYLQGFLDRSESHEPEGSEQASSSGHDSDTLAQSFESEGLYLLKKKDEDLFSGTNKPKARRSRKDKKRVVQNKPIIHSPQALNQFAELQIKAPATVQEIPEAILKVESKKMYYESLPSIPHSSHSIAGFPYRGGSAGAPSIAESAITESTPTTPEVQADAVADPFLGAEAASDYGPWRVHRKLSHDSGACELETECDEQRTPEYTLESNPLLMSPCAGTTPSGGAVAGGDLPWQSDLARRTLSTVSSQSDKDSSASSDTVVESPHSCDDLRAAEAYYPVSDLTFESGDSSVDFERTKAVSAQKNTFKGLRNVNSESRDASGELLLGSIQKLAVTHCDVLCKLGASSLLLKTEPVAEGIQSAVEQVYGAPQSKDNAPVIGLESIMRMSADIQSNESFQKSSVSTQSPADQAEMTIRDPVDTTGMTSAQGESKMT